MTRRASTPLLLGTGLLLALGMGEGAVRVLEAAGIVADDLDPSLFPPVPHRAKFMRSKNQLLLFELDPSDPLINAGGFRGRDVPRERTGALRILALGDSVTFGHGVAPCETYPEVLEALLAADSPPGGAEVLNFGVGGYNTSQELELYRTKGRSYAPDVLIVGFVLNDCFPARALLAHSRNVRSEREAARANPPPQAGPATARPERAPPPRRWPESRLARLVASRLARLGDAAEGGHTPAFVLHCTDPRTWERVRVALAGLARLASEDNTAAILVIWPMLEDFDDYRYAALHARVAAEARRDGFVVLDLLSAFAGRDPEELRLMRRDKTHPNAAANRLAAESIHALLVERGLLAVRQ